MTKYDLFEKYKKYEIEFNTFDDIVEIKKPIEVNKFLELKVDLIKSKIDYNDILIIDRRNRRKWRKM